MYSQTTKINILELVKTRHISKCFPNAFIIQTRIAEAKPHSTDFECLISTSNLLKSPFYSTVTAGTENLYLKSLLIHK